MSTSYAAPVTDSEDDTEISTAEAAELLGVSLDTMRALFRDGTVPARRVKVGGTYVAKRSDVEQAREQRAAGLRAGPAVQISEDDRARLREARQADEEAERERKRALYERYSLVAELGRKARGTRAMASALGVSTSTVQGLLREADVPVVHHRQQTPLASAEIEALGRAQRRIDAALANLDEAHDAREALTRELLERGGYGTAVAIAAELGRHRGRLFNPRKRRRQG